jgi:hypothetical protein
VTALATMDVGPRCWMCSSADVSVVFAGYRRAYCKAGCKEEHDHHEDVPSHNLTCRGCGNSWVDGSGDFATRN